MREREQVVADQLTRDGIAWMWSNELPENYKASRLCAWFAQENYPFPVILNGSRYWRDNTQPNRAYASQMFIERAARMLRLTYYPHDDEPALFWAIINRAHKRWPLVRAKEQVLRSEFYSWVNGRKVPLLVNSSEHQRPVDLLVREHALRNIKRLLHDIAKLEKEQ